MEDGLFLSLFHATASSEFISVVYLDGLDCFDNFLQWLLDVFYSSPKNCFDQSLVLWCFGIWFISCGEIDIPFYLSSVLVSSLVFSLLLCRTSPLDCVLCLFFDVFLGALIECEWTRNSNLPRLFGLTGSAGRALCLSPSFPLYLSVSSWHRPVLCEEIDEWESNFYWISLSSSPLYFTVMTLGFSFN